MTTCTKIQGGFSLHPSNSSYFYERLLVGQILNHPQILSLAWLIVCDAYPGNGGMNHGKYN